jgi:DNA-binding response OmpR family regulator
MDNYAHRTGLAQRGKPHAWSAPGQLRKIAPFPTACSTMRVLVVEDDPALRLGISRTLQAEGWQVDAVTDGEYALAATATQDYDAAVLDLGLPRRSGQEVLRQWRNHGKNLTVVILTANDGLSSRLDGLNSGADDYMAKPFEPEELVARLRAIARRRSGNISNLLHVGSLSFNTDSRELYFGEQRIALSPRETALLELLMTSPGTAVPKSRIISAMSSWESNFSANSVEIYILKLRRKLAEAGVTIVTLRGVGYVLEPL